MTAPILVLTIGNASRGDDALGPELGARLGRAGLTDLEVICECQLQIEHALDLEGRQLVVFVDAGTATKAPCELRWLEPAVDFRHTTHALSPQALLATYVSVTGRQPPRSLLLSVRGESFELGAELSAAARANLEAAWQRLLALCAQ